MVSKFREKYVDDDKPLYLRVDFLGMIADFGKGTLLALVSVLAGIVVSFQGAVGQMFNAGMDGIRLIGSVFVDVPNQLAAAAFGSASAQLDLFGIFALPASAAIAVTAVAGISLTIAIFWGV